MPWQVEAAAVPDLSSLPDLQVEAADEQFVFTAEGRYNWANDPMEGGFVGFDNIDLDGLQLIGGIAIRF